MNFMKRVLTIYFQNVIIGSFFFFHKKVSIDEIIQFGNMQFQNFFFAKYLKN